MAQLTSALTERPAGKLPSTTENNPREHVQAITLRSGKEVQEPKKAKEAETEEKADADSDKVEEEMQKLRKDKGKEV